jgi:hypothetical protein
VALTVGSLGVLPFAKDPALLSASAYLGGLAWSSAFLVYLAALQQTLHVRQDETTGLLASVGFAGGIVNAAVIVLSVVFFAVALRVPDDRLALEEVSFLANNFTGFATAVCVGGFSAALRRTGFPGWLVGLGAAVGLHHLASAAAFASAGFWSPAGPLSSTAPLGMALWVGAVALLSWQRRDRL